MMRYDPDKQVYRDCRWCKGRRCIYCKSEADKAYKAEFPDGLKPIATFPATPEGMEAARAVVGREAIEKAFGPDGGGVAEIFHNIAEQSKDKS